MLALYLAMLEDEEDHPIFCQMYEQYHSTAYGVALSILKNHEQAEDAAMASWEKVIKEFDKAKKYFQESCSVFAPWFVVIVKHTAIDDRRRRKFTVEFPESWDAVSPESVEERSRTNAMIGLIRSMPEGYRSVLELRLVSEWAYPQIGRAVGLSADAARMCCNRGMEMLRQKLREEGITIGAD